MKDITIHSDELNAYKKVKRYIKQQGYNFHVGEVVEGYYRKLEGDFNTRNIEDCIDLFENELKILMVRY